MPSGVMATMFSSAMGLMVNGVARAQAGFELAEGAGVGVGITVGASVGAAVGSSARAVAGCGSGASVGVGDAQAEKNVAARMLVNIIRTRTRSPVEIGGWVDQWSRTTQPSNDLCP